MHLWIFSPLFCKQLKCATTLSSVNHISFVKSLLMEGQTGDTVWTWAFLSELTLFGFSFEALHCLLHFNSALAMPKKDPGAFLTNQTITITSGGYAFDGIYVCFVLIIEMSSEIFFMRIWDTGVPLFIWLIVDCAFTFHFNADIFSVVYENTHGWNIWLNTQWH